MVIWVPVPAVGSAATRTGRGAVNARHAYAGKPPRILV